MIDLLVVELPDRRIPGSTETHYARPGYVNALCGAERISNADTLEPTEIPMCADCLAIPSSDGYRHPLRPATTGGQST